MEKCKKCKGTGILLPRIPYRFTFKCNVCGGKGEVSNEQVVWIEKGGELKKRRLDKGLTLRDGAKQTGMDVTVLSQMENGIVEPNENLFR